MLSGDMLSKWDYEHAGLGNGGTEAVAAADWDGVALA
jgi:hypothetical protein